jgi:hypothetical protein
MLFAFLLASSGAVSAANPFSEIMKGVKSTLAGTNVVIGTVEVMSPFPGIVTCFKDTPGGAISRGPIQSLTQAEGFPSLIVTRSGVVTTAQCAELQKQGLLASATGAAGGAAGGTAPPYRSIHDTELDGFFERHPQPGGGKWVEWPRVAITLTDAPAWGKDKQNVHHFKFPSTACWTFSARIWESEKKSRDIAPFQYCTSSPLTVHGGDSEMVYQVWSGIVGGSSGLTSTNARSSSGIQRTEGPLWPDTPLPVGTRAGQAFVNQATFNGMILYMLMYDTGIDFNVEDHRVWVNVPESLMKP